MREARQAQSDPPPRSGRRGWRTAPLRHKAVLLTLLPLASGALIASLDASLGSPAWILLIGIVAASLIFCPIMIQTFCTPVEDLRDAVRQATSAGRVLKQMGAASKRVDEIGRLAHHTRELSVAAFRQVADAQRLRRTIDRQIEQATRQATHHLRRLSHRDPLTDLGNRRFLDENLPTLIESCLQSGTELSCVIIDLDHFKQANDTAGHETGDELLRFVADLLRSQVRDTDFAIRLGGDEFALFIPGATCKRVHEITTRVRTLFEQQCQASAGALRICSMSFGVAWLLADKAEDDRMLMRLADSRLYTEKRIRKRTGVARRVSA